MLPLIYYAHTTGRDAQLNEPVHVDTVQIATFGRLKTLALFPSILEK